MSEDRAHQMISVQNIAITFDFLNKRIQLNFNEKKLRKIPCIVSSSCLLNRKYLNFN